ncbi:hypothetical protein GLOIN_2v1811004 [Rhizophagus irregularis DAOM 181602=DAOM 197198]|nr:hypothetical protein GLOIN_2v1811004 [Rhizophagus irregularis DAOM 181602=DAOM 197198]
MSVCGNISSVPPRELLIELIQFILKYLSIQDLKKCLSIVNYIWKGISTTPFGMGDNFFDLSSPSRGPVDHQLGRILLNHELYDRMNVRFVRHINFRICFNKYFFRLIDSASIGWNFCFSYTFEKKKNQQDMLSGKAIRGWKHGCKVCDECDHHSHLYCKRYKKVAEGIYKRCECPQVI